MGICSGKAGSVDDSAVKSINAVSNPALTSQNEDHEPKEVHRM